jgi:O-antigen ligase
MISKASLAAILPNYELDRKFIIPFGILITAVCLSMVLAPALAMNLVIVIFAISCILLFRIHVLQLVLISTMLPMILPFISQDMASIVISVLVTLSLSWIIGRIALGYGRLEHGWIIDIIIAFNIFFAINALVSTSYNSIFTIFAISEALKFIFYAGLLLIIYHYMNNISITQRLILTVIFASLLIATYCYYLASSVIGIKGFLMLGGMGMHGLSIGLSNANTISMVIANSIPILLAYIMFGHNKRKKLLCFLIFLYLLIIILPLNSRGTYLFIFTASFALIIFHNRRRRYLIIIAGLFVAGYIVMATNIFPILKLLLRLENALTYREDLWKAAFRMIAESPVLGKGPDYFMRYKFIYMDPSIGRFMIGSMGGLSPHNVLLLRAVDLGITAMLIQLFLWVFPIIIFIKNIKFVRYSQYFYLYLASGAIWIGIIFRSLFDTGNNVFGMIMLVTMLRMPIMLKKSSLDPI